jgi:hypothetical protein
VFKYLLATLLAIMAFGCGSKPNNQVDPRLDAEMPKNILWAWERPEDLRFIDPNEYGVAFLAQTIFLENDRVIPKPRRQPLDVPPGTYVIAVTRIETKKEMSGRPTLNEEMLSAIVGLIRNTVELPNVRGIQVDFDAVVSEREFYRKMMKTLSDELKDHDAEPRSSNDDPATHNSQLTTHHSFTMTALASWCAGDTWFNDFPVDEAVPMVFVMGADQESIRNFLRRGNDWREPLCRGSYGISIDEPKLEGLKPNRRMYYFKNSPWVPADLPNLR